MSESETNKFNREFNKILEILYQGDDRSKIELRQVFNRFTMTNKFILFRDIGEYITGITDADNEIRRYIERERLGNDDSWLRLKKELAILQGHSLLDKNIDLSEFRELITKKIAAINALEFAKKNMVIDSRDDDDDDDYDDDDNGSSRTFSEGSSPSSPRGRPRTGTSSRKRKLSVVDFKRVSADSGISPGIITEKKKNGIRYDVINEGVPDVGFSRGFVKFTPEYEIYESMTRGISSVPKLTFVQWLNKYELLDNHNKNLRILKGDEEGSVTKYDTEARELIKREYKIYIKYLKYKNKYLKLKNFGS